MAFEVETGDGVEDANSYATVEQGDDFFGAHLYGAAWTGMAGDDAAKTAKKQAALIMASRMLDSACAWRGLRLTQTQGLEWPRYGAKLDGDPSALNSHTIQSGSENLEWEALLEVPSDIVPKPILNATIELCRFLLASDRETDADGAVVKKEKVDVIEVEYVDGGGRPDIIPESVLRFVRPYTLTAPSAGGAAAAKSFSLIRG